MKRKWLNGLMAVMFLIIQFSTLITSRRVNAEPINPTTIIDQPELKMTVAGSVVADQIIWKVAYQRPTSQQSRALKLRVSTDETGESRLAPEQNELVQPLQAADGVAAHQWLIEKNYTTQSIGELTFKTPVTQATLHVAAQLNEIIPATADAAGATTTEPQIKADLLDAKIAGPHAVTTTVPEPEVKPEAEVPAVPETPAAPEPEVTTKPEAAEETPLESEAGLVQEATPETAGATTEAEDEADTRDTSDTKEVLPAPSQDNPLAANNLILTLGARAVLQVAVDGLQPSQYNKYSKEHGDAALSKYSTENAMKTRISSDYEVGSSAEAVIMNTFANARNAKISLDYSEVGYVQTASGDVSVGAYVTIDNIETRSSDWTNTSAAGRVGIDFSTNFYSGISLANIREFNWNVTFYYVDGGTKRAVNFVPGTDHQQALLTFTSLNPGEFVMPQNASPEVVVSDNTGIALKYLNINRLVPSDSGAFANYVWPTSGFQAYTSQKWGNWNQGAAINPDKEWADWLGAATFGDGAVSFGLIGTTFSYKRGTYSTAATTWLANASGTAKFKIPPLANNKSITTIAGEGGGSANQKHGDIYTDNALDTTNIDQIAASGQTMYYYINQETYTVVEELMSRPNEIVIEDTLPAGISLANDRLSDIMVFNETISDRTAPQPLTTFTNGVSANGSKIEKTNTADGRVKIKVTLKTNDVMKIPFKSGYFSVQIKVKSDYKPDEIDEEKKMTNSATVKMFDAKANEAYAETTNEVYVTVKPHRPEVDVSFTKVDDDKKPLAGAKFGLFTDKNGTTAKYQSNVTLEDGKVTFTQVTPGTYWLKEIETPSGYQSASAIKVTIDDQGRLSGLTNNQVVNKLKLYALELIKKGEDDQRLTGAKFVVKADNDIVATGVSKADSTMVFDNQLKPGTYTLEEVEAPAGYKALAGKFSFTLEKAGTLTGLAYSGDELAREQWDIKMSGDKTKVVFDITNPAETHELPVTGGAGIGGLLTIAVLLMGAASGAWWLRRQKEVK